jgi:hypothetical protein
MTARAIEVKVNVFLGRFVWVTPVTFHRAALGMESGEAVSLLGEKLPPEKHRRGKK